MSVKDNRCSTCNTKPNSGIRQEPLLSFIKNSTIQGINHRKFPAIIPPPHFEDSFSRLRPFIGSGELSPNLIGHALRAAGARGRRHLAGLRQRQPVLQLRTDTRRRQNESTDFKMSAGAGSPTVAVVAAVFDLKGEGWNFSVLPSSCRSSAC